MGRPIDVCLTPKGLVVLRNARKILANLVPQLDLNATSTASERESCSGRALVSAGLTRIIRIA
jgi:hypothetical protein